MESALNILIPIAMGIVAIILAIGIFNMLNQKAGSASRSNRLMRLRIIAQFVAVVLIMTMLYVTSS